MGFYSNASGILNRVIAAICEHGQIFKSCLLVAIAISLVIPCGRIFLKSLRGLFCYICAPDGRFTKTLKFLCVIYNEVFSPFSILFLSFPNEKRELIYFVGLSMIVKD